MERDWLRFYDAKGDWILTPEEQERARAEQAQDMARRYREKLLELGIDPDRP